jgi:hypothetical protein
MMFMARVVQMAISVDAMATAEMSKGPNNLQKRSIRRMRAFSTAAVSTSRPHPKRAY